MITISNIVITRAPAPYPIRGFSASALRWRIVATSWPGRGHGQWTWWRDSARDAYYTARSLARRAASGREL